MRCHDPLCSLASELKAFASWDEGRQSVRVQNREEIQGDPSNPHYRGEPKFKKFWILESRRREIGKPLERKITF